MLEPAFYNQVLLQEKYSHFATSKKSFFALPFPLRYQLELEDTNRFLIQVVSKNTKNEIIGFLEAQVDRYNNIVESLFIIKFCDNNSFQFVKDTICFCNELFFTHGFNKIVFQTILNNPANSIFYRFIKQKKIGRKVGILKGHNKNIDGRDYDVVIYEIYKYLWAQNFKL